MKQTKQTLYTVATWGLLIISGLAFWGLFYGLLWLGYILGFEM